MNDSKWADRPLSAIAEDTLDRDNYAKAAADLIVSTFSYDLSVVFGLSGPWGSGKTSFIAMTEEHLRTTHPDWHISHFTPWATSDETGLIAEFYASLARGLPVKKSRHLRAALATAAMLAAPTANVIPVAGATAAEIARAGAQALVKARPWQDVFKEASEEIEKLRRPILIVVDDVDRLHSNELMTLLKVVRLLGRFPGVQYLLAYDDDTLHRSLTHAGAAQPLDGSAERFMEKIVQYPVLVPPLLRHQQVTRLHAGLKRTTRTVDTSTAGAQTDRIDALMQCFTGLLRTPRAIDRFIAQLEHHIPLLPPGEIDDEDVILLTLVRVAFPGLFNDLPKFREPLVSGHTGQLAVGRSIDRVKFDPVVLLTKIPAEHADTGRLLLASLFPRLEWPDTHVIDVSYPSATGRGVGSDGYFDRYFAMAIPSHDISDQEVREAVVAATLNDPSPLTTLLTQPNDDRAQLAITKASGDDNTPAATEARLNLATTLAAIASQLPEDPFTAFGRVGQIVAWTGNLIGSLAGTATHAEAKSILNGLNATGLAVRAMSHVEDAARRIENPNAGNWVFDLNEWLVEQAIGDFVQHLSEGDAASQHVPQGALRHYAIKHGHELELRARIAELIGTGAITIADLAARFVPAHGSHSGAGYWTLSEDVDQESFDKLAPPEDDPWYSSPKEAVDIHDLGWLNRRKFAAGRFTPPTSTLAPAEPTA
ncbi:KAP family NTPase [Nocardioides sp. 503]|uniref:KAP family NTPase n=1 Tax=Nocardioides sp. 503 TaxID=2508326 RepID=UPI00107021A7|nr:KAP family NTPase [Nocardioides sp. 503]